MYAELSPKQIIFTGLKKKMKCLIEQFQQFTFHFVFLLDTYKSLPNQYQNILEENKYNLSILKCHAKCSNYVEILISIPSLRFINRVCGYFYQKFILNSDVT